MDKQVRAGSLVEVAGINGMALVLTQPDPNQHNVLIASVYPAGSVPRTSRDVQIDADESQIGHAVQVALWNTRRALVSDLTPVDLVSGDVVQAVLNVLDQLEFDEEPDSPRVSAASLGALSPDRIAKFQSAEVGRWLPVTESLMSELREVQQARAPQRKRVYTVAHGGTNWPDSAANSDLAKCA